MLRETANLTVLKAEIFNGHRLLQQLGNKKARYLMRSFLKDLSSIVWSSNGESIRTLNDKLICTFFSADDAVIAATTMHQFAFARPSIKLNDYQSLGLQIRICTGNVDRIGKNIQGNAVDFAAHDYPMARPFQTLISESARDDLSERYAGQTRFESQWSINGNDDLVNVYEYIDDPEETTLTQETLPESESSPILDLIHGSTILTVDDRYPVCTIGRLVRNDLILKYPCVSRWHAKVEKRENKFILKDTSANGTFIKIGNLETVCLKHDELRLIGKGVIFPGRKATPGSPGAIHFNLR